LIIIQNIRWRRRELNPRPRKPAMKRTTCVARFGNFKLRAGIATPTRSGTLLALGLAMSSRDAAAVGCAHRIFGIPLSV